MISTYIYGAGKYGVLTALDCEQKGIKVVGFIDRDADKIKTRFGLPVLTLQDIDIISKLKEHNIIIAIKNENIANEAKKLLLDYGIFESKMRYYFEMEPIKEYWGAGLLEELLSEQQNEVTYG